MSRRLLLQQVLLVLAFVPGSNAVQQTSQIAAGAWRISGRVVDARSGAQLARCSVQIDMVEPGGASRSLLTGDDGQFIFDYLPRGKYQLTAAKRGYLRQSYEQHDEFWTGIAVGPELNSEGLIFEVTPQAVISGLITDERGEPVRQAQVRLFKDQNLMGLRTTETQQSVLTDDRGLYQLANIGPGNYYIAVSAQPWYAQRMTPRQANDPPESEADSPLDVAYPMTFYPQGTDSDAATPIPIRGGERIQADLTLTAERAARLRIKLPVEDPNHPGAYGIMISRSIFGQTEQVATGQTMRDGVMEIEGVLPGHYEFALGRSDGSSPQSESTRFSANVASGTTELTPVDAEGEVTVVGKVTSMEGKIPSGAITFQPTNKGMALNANLDQAGEFTVKLMPGDYEIIGQIQQMYVARLRSQDGALKGQVFPVKAGSTPKLEILVSQGFARLDGVAKRSDRPAGGVMVLLAPDDNKILFSRDQSDSDGTFTIANIVPGRYRLLAVERGWELEWANRNVLNAFLKKSIPVEIHANDKLSRTIEVQSREPIP